MKSISEELASFAGWMFSAALSSLFLVFWVILQSIVQIVVDEFTLIGIDKWQLIIFQWLFAIATITPIASYIIKNCIQQLYATWQSIREEIST